jgi:hypothetical protein
MSKSGLYAHFLMGNMAYLLHNDPRTLEQARTAFQARLARARHVR